MGKFFYTVLVFICFLVITLNVSAQYHLSYDYAMELARTSLARGDYSDALHYFQIALILRPDKEEPLFYINAIKRAREGATHIITPRSSPQLPRPYHELREQTLPVQKKDKQDRIKEVLDFLEQSVVPPTEEKGRGEFETNISSPEPPSLMAKEETMKEEMLSQRVEKENLKEKNKKVSEYLNRIEKELARRKKEIFAPVSEVKKAVKPPAEEIATKEEKKLVSRPSFPSPTEEVTTLASPREEKVAKGEAMLVSPKEKREAVKARTLYLTDELFAVQPGTKVEIEIRKSLIIEGTSIKRYLVVTPGFIQVTRIDDKRIRIDALHIGSTFLHIWEQDRRWTFNIEVVLPTISLAERLKREKALYEEKPFKFSYSANWSSYYRGRRLGTMNRDSLSLSQWVGIEGNTPYGHFDTSARIAKFGSKTEVTNYTVGLTNARIWNFSDFDIRGFDVYKGFSPLSYPGQLIEGVSLDASAFNKKIRYSLLWGKEREGSFGFITPGILAERDSYVEGARVKLLPSQNFDFALNYIHGYGIGREDYLKDKVYSVEFEGRKVVDGKIQNFSSEIAYDGDSLAATFSSGFHVGKTNMKFRFRNIEKDFTTITGRPSGRGEIGAIFSMDTSLGTKTYLSGNIDIYRNRFLFNESKKNKLNFNTSLNFNRQLSPKSSFSTSITYNNTPQESFPRRYLSVINTYSKSFNLLNRRFSTFLTLNYQRSRNPLSLSSDYDAYILSTGLRFPVTDNLSYYFDYDYTWLKERFDSSRTNPSVMEMGIDYNKQITHSLDGNLRFYYRNEEETSSTHSFLSGQDSIEGDINFTYHPHKDFQFFIDGRVRNVWAENPESDKFIEASIRFGVRGSWDLPFRWNPVGVVSGYVFKDINSNGKDDNEPRIEDIKVIVGKKELTTDENGEFSTRVRAKKVRIKVDSESLPPGYVFTTPSVAEVDIINGKESRVIFGITSSASIYGIVFYDVNGNGKFDRGEPTINGVKIIVNKKTKITSGQGTYYFRGLPEGKYTIMFDVNSLPMEYLPSVPVKKEISLSEGVNYIYNIPLHKK